MELVSILSICALFLVWQLLSLSATLRAEQSSTSALKAELEKRSKELEDTSHALLQKSAEFQVLTDTLPPVVWTATPDGLIDFYSRRWDEYTGLHFKDTSGASWQQVVHPDDLAPCLALWTNCLQSGEPFQFEYRWRGHDKVYRWFLAQARPVRDKDGSIVKWFGTSTNIDTNKRQAELLEEKVKERTIELAESELKFRAIFNHTFQLIGLLEKDGRTIDVNQTALDYQGITADEVIGRPFWQTPWFSHSEEVQEQIRKAVTEVAQGKFVRFEVKHLRPSGASLIDFSLKPVFDENDNVMYLIPEGRDITERKEHEEMLRELADRLSRSNNDLQQFAYVASHDLQEPLRTVISFSNLLMRKAGGTLEPDAQKYLDVIVESVERMQQLIRDLLLYASVETKGQPLVPVDLETPIVTAIKNLDAAIKETGAQINFEKMPTVPGDANQLTRLFQNLFSNSIKFRGCNSPSIQICVTEEDGFAKLSVSDNGIGISMEYAERIFEIFQRLHAQNKYPGTGIGLAVCKRIAERHGGNIALRTGDEGGATFEISLPLAQP